MPEAAMHEDHGPVTRENQVRRAWQVADMKLVSEAGSVKIASHHELGASILSANGGHHARAYPRVNYIRHWNRSDQ